MFLNDSAKRAELSCMACRPLHVAQASKAGMPIPEGCFGSGIAGENLNCYTNKSCETTPRGFEPLRAEPNGYRVHLLNRSDTVSVTLKIPYTYAVRNNSGKSGCQGKTPARQHAFARSRRCCSSLAERKHVDTPQAVQRYETIGFPLGIIR